MKLRPSLKMMNKMRQTKQNLMDFQEESDQTSALQTSFLESDKGTGSKKQLFATKVSKSKNIHPYLRKFAEC